jgi:hypothetical protein
VERVADAFEIADVSPDEPELADLPQGLDEVGIARVARGDPHADPAPEQKFADIPADEAIAAENRHLFFEPLDHGVAH